MKNQIKIQRTEYNDSDFVTLEVAAQYINMSLSFLKKIKRNNEIPFYKIGKKVRFKISDLKQYIESCRICGEEKGVDNETH